MHDPLSGTDTPFVLYGTVSFVDSQHSAIFSGATTIQHFSTITMSCIKANDHFNISRRLLISISATTSRQNEYINRNIIRESQNKLKRHTLNMNWFNLIQKLNIVRYSLILFIGYFHRELKWVTKGTD